MPSILIHDAGPQTTVQDLGRRGSLRVGIPPSGPMDREAFLLANRLVGLLHGCLRHQTLYDEHIAWAHRHQQAA